MADQLYFSRDTKFYVVYENSAGVPQHAWEVPILEGYSFSQAVNTTEVTLAEMEDSGGVSRRAKAMFNDSLAPVEWSISTYVRPYISATYDSKVHAAEDPLWAMMMGADTFFDNTTEWVFRRGANNVTTQSGDGSATATLMDFNQSNVSSLADTISFYFVYDTGADLAGAVDHLVYKIASATVNEATIDFDVDGIATINFSGFGSTLTDVSDRVFYKATQPVDADTANGAPGTGIEVGDIWFNSTLDDQFNICDDGTDSSENFIPAADEAVCSTNTFIRNRLTQVSIEAAAADQDAYPGASGTGVYNLTLTGGSITISNNITYLVPDELGCVNVPIGNITGTRSVSGTMSAYVELDAGANQGDNAGETSALFKDFTSAAGLGKVTNSFALEFGVGGSAGATFGTSPDSVPLVGFQVGQAHLDIPVHNIDDVLSLEINFNGLASDMSSTDEIVIAYSGVSPS